MPDRPSTARRWRQQWELLSEPGFTGLKDEPDYETATL
jgi:hypothetical protein